MVRKSVPKQKDWAFRSVSSDPLASALAVCARLQGRDVGSEAILAGVALPRDGLLTPELALGAMETHGFRATLVRRKIAALPTSVYPVILFLRGREACVLIENKGGTLSVIWPLKSDEPVEISSEELVEAYMGYALLMRNDQTVMETDPDVGSDDRHWFWGTVRNYWPEYMHVVLASVLINVLALAVPLFTMNVYDRVFPTAALITLWSLVAAVGLALVFDALLKWVRSAVINAVGRGVDQVVSASIFRHISDLKLQWNMQASGTLVNTLKDYEQVRDFFSSQTLATLIDLCFSVLFIAVIAYIGGPLAIPPAIALVFVLVLGGFIIGPLQRSANASRDMTGVKNAVAVEAITELETLKSVAGQGRMQARWERQVAESARANDRSKQLATFATTVTGFAQQASSVGIVIFGVYLALEGSLTMGAVIAAMILSGRALAPTATLAGLFVRASFAMSTMRSLNALMASPSHKPAPNLLLNARIDAGAFEFQDVSLTYGQAQVAAVKDLSFRTEGLDRIGLVGPVGAGKTSLTRLMSGLYEPSDGMITVDGLNMAQLSPATLRRDIQLVPQNAVLFSGSLAENIAFGMPQASMEDVLRVSRLTGVDALAAKDPMGFAMPIAERGANLSGGQRQLVALARALLPDPRVLILDEPSSSMDTASETAFVERLRRILDLRSMTLIISTHRMGLLELVDRVIVLDDGRIKLDGDRKMVLDTLQGGRR